MSRDYFLFSSLVLARYVRLHTKVILNLNQKATERTPECIIQNMVTVKVRNKHNLNNSQNMRIAISIRIKSLIETSTEYAIMIVSGNHCDIQ